MGSILLPPRFGENKASWFGVKGRHVFVVRVEGNSMVLDLHLGNVLVINLERVVTNFKIGVDVVKHDDKFKIRWV